ncbi:MAG: GNAT family N-acetyltransferase [Mucilaginibacter sp.]
MPPNKATTIKRSEANDPDFPFLVALLNQELRERYGGQQLVYDRFDQLINLETVVIAYRDDVPAGCGCFDKFDETTVEIKRMFVTPPERRQGIALSILNELEVWAKEDGFTRVLLETGMKQPEAIALYQKAGYEVILNYGPYVGMDNSVCMGKEL